MTLRWHFWELWHSLAHGEAQGKLRHHTHNPQPLVKAVGDLDNAGPCSQHREKINSLHSSQKVQRELHKPQYGDKGTAILGRGRSHHAAPQKLLQGRGFSTSTRTKLPSTATTPPHHICRNWVFKIPLFVPKLTKSPTLTNPGRNAATREAPTCCSSGE